MDAVGDFIKQPRSSGGDGTKTAPEKRPFNLAVASVVYSQRLDAEESAEGVVGQVVDLVIIQ